LNGAESVVLLTRSGVVAYDSSDMWDEVCQYGASKVTVMRCDVGDSVAVSRMIAEVRSLHGRVCGVLHAAGTLEDKLLTNQSVSNFTRVCDPKMNGAWNLHSATLADPIQSFLLYSSITSALGAAGQSNYGFANAWLDSLASSRQQMGLSAVSAQWGAWGGIGMAERNGIISRLTWLMPIQAAHGSKICGALLNGNTTKLSTVCVFGADWSKHSGGKLPLALDSLQGNIDHTATSVQKAEMSHSMIESAVFGLVADVTGESVITRTTSFMDVGLDSLSTVELVEALQSLFNVSLDRLPPIDLPTVGEVVDHIVVLRGSELSPSREAITTVVLQVLDETTGIDGIGGATSLIEAGLDSLGAVEFTEDLQTKFGICMERTPPGDLPTVTDIVDHVIQQLTRKQETEAATTITAPSSTALKNEANVLVIEGGSTTITREGCGSIVFLGLHNAGSELLSMVKITKGRIHIDDALYDSPTWVKPVLCTLHGLFPTPGGCVDLFEKKLQTLTENMGGMFINYDRDDGSWMFKINPPTTA